VETIYLKVPNYFHWKRKTFPALFVDFDVLLYLKENRLKLDFRKKLIPQLILFVSGS